MIKCKVLLLLVVGKQTKLLTCLIYFCFSLQSLKLPLPCCIFMMCCNLCHAHYSPLVHHIAQMSYMFNINNSVLKNTPFNIFLLYIFEIRSVLLIRLMNCRKDHQTLISFVYQNNIYKI